VGFEEAGEYVLFVNGSCLDTQKLPQWMDNSTTINIYAPPNVEFEYTPTTNVYVNSTIVFNATRSYARGPNSQIATYAWDFADGTNTTTFISIVEHEFEKVGNYTVSLNVTDDSAFRLSNVSTTQIWVRLLGDINGDGQVNIVDITIVAAAFNSQPGMLSWNPAADLNNDKTVNILDLAMVAKEYGNHD
jgi:PKD repeat protein